MIAAGNPKTCWLSPRIPGYTNSYTGSPHEERGIQLLLVSSLLGPLF